MTDPDKDYLFGSTSWTCHVCGCRRADAKISVFTRTILYHGVPMTMNIRYCNDVQSCIEGAKTYSFVEEST